ncbi:MAG: hypothetical protein ACREBG_07955 [Pyrinomonadaceae bacterium]
MSTKYPLPVRYVLYSHYPEGRDYERYCEGEADVSKLDGVKYLVSHLAGLSGLLTWTGFEGLLVLFYSPGFAKVLEGIESREDEGALLRYKELEFAKAVETYLKSELKKDYDSLLPRFRFVTALDLQRIFGRMYMKNITQPLRSWFFGQGEDEGGMKYDSPKTVEAIVRVRLLGSGIPVFRLDYDVLFRGAENSEKKNLEFSSTIGSCLKAYELKRDSPNIFSFIFSASYDYRALRKNAAAQDFNAWSRAFATRVFPAIPLKKEQIDKINCKNGEKPSYSWQDYAQECFSPYLAFKFFGLDDQFKSGTLSGIGKIGAHPISSVISGAMLYLSDGAILDLPPFSNFRLNVMWIDDHLKYCLHRELRHLSRTEVRATATQIGSNPLLSHARLDDVLVQKTGRKVSDNFAEYLFNQYLPTLLWGTIMDAWITGTPLLKFRPEDLSDQERDTFSILQEKQCESVLGSALQNALRQGGFEPPARKTLVKNLMKEALIRINDVRKQWMELTEDGIDTFASVWAKGTVHSYFSRLKLKYPGIADAELKLTEEISDPDHLNRNVHLGLLELIEDATDYIQWTLDWPKIVQVVRSIEQGTVKTDLNFEDRD